MKLYQEELEADSKFTIDADRFYRNSLACKLNELRVDQFQQVDERLVTSVLIGFAEQLT